MIRLYIISIALFLGAMGPQSLFAQCQEVLDNEGIATSNPTWYNCSAADAPLSIETSTSWTDLVIDWGDGSATEAIGAFNPGDAPVSHTYTGGASSYTVTLAEADGSCTIEGHYYASAPVSDFWSSETSVCEGTSVQFHQEATGVQYAWNFGVNPNFLNTSTGHVSFTFSNPGDYTVQSVIQFPGTNGACADTSSIDITVLPRPEVHMTLSATEGCGELTVSGDVSAADSYLYVWSFMPEPSFQVGTQLDPITFTTPGNHPIAVAVTGVNGCQSTAQEFVTVHPQPEADFSFEGICFGNTTSFSDESTASYTTNITGWYWQFGDGGVSYESNPSHDYAFTGDYNVSLTVTTPDCSASTSQFVGINPNPTVEAQADILSGCSPLEVAFNADASLASTFAWEIDGNALSGESVDATLETAIGDGSGHTATVTVTSSVGCTATDNITVDAFPRAIAQMDPVANAGCAPYAPSIANLSEGAIAYEWYANGNFVTSSAVWDGTLENINNAIESQTIELVAHSLQGCNDTTSTTIQVYPEADFTFDLPNDTACSPLELTMPFMDGVNSFTWNFGGGNTSTEQAPSIVLENTNGGLMGTSITFTGISVFGCIDSHTETVYVRPQPVAQFTSDATEGCEPLAANFENISSDADSYVWDFGNGITDDGPTASQAFYTEGSIQTYDITLTAYDDLGCTDTDTLTVTVYPAADITLDLGVDAACSPLEMTLPVIEGIQNIAWDFGDGTTSNEATPDHAWENTSGGLDNYIVSVTGETEHGCGGLAVDLITVKPMPTAAFTADALSGCEPLSSAFTSNSTEGTTLNWDFGDGTNATGSAVNHTFDGIDANTDFEVALTATHELGCADIATATVEVFAAAEYALNLGADSVCSPLELTMPVLDGAHNFTWNFGDGTTSNEATPTHTWFNASTGLMTAIVTLEAETAEGCPGTSEATVNIKPQPIANFMVANDEGCDPLVSQFNNYSMLADSYDWDFGDGTTGHEEHPAHTFTAEGSTTTFEVTLTAHDDLGCSDATTREVTVHPAAAFTLSLASDTVCSPLQLTLPEIPGAENLIWDFGDGTTAAGQSPTHTWVNTGEDLMEATVSFEAATTNGCVGSGSATVYIKPQPTADFTVTFESGCSPLSVAFYNTSTQADAFFWDFGNGSTASTPTAIAAFEAEDIATTYTVTLNAMDDLGCTSTATQEITAFPSANFTLELPADSVCSPLELTMPVLDGAQAITWNFGDGTTATGQAPAHTWENTTGELMTATVSFSAESENGCIGSATAEVNIKPQPEANFTVDAAAGCAPLVSTFTNASTNGDLYIWNFGDDMLPGLVDNNPTVQHTFIAEANDAPSFYNVTLLAIDDLGCTDERSMAIEVNPTPAFELNLEANEACSPLALTMPNMVDATATYWDFGDGSFSNEATPTHFWTNDTDELMSHTISFQGFNAFGCEGSATANVSIKPQPQAIFSIDEEVGCAPFNIAISNESQLADAFDWNYGNGDALQMDTQAAHAYTYAGADEPTDYTLTLTATHALGCVDTTTKTVTVLPEVIAAWSGETVGCAPFETVIEYTGTAASTVAWTIDGAAAASGNAATFELEGAAGSATAHTIEIEAVSEYGCAGSAAFEVTVNPTPLVNLSASSDATCSGDAWNVVYDAQYADDINLTMDGMGLDLASELEFTSENPGSVDAISTLVLTASTDQGCAAAMAIEHTVHPQVTANFDLPMSTCSPMEVAFNNTSVQATASTTWNFGDGTTSEALNPAHTFEALGTEDAQYNVTLVAVNAAGCADTAVHVIEVWGQPEAALNVVEAVGCYPVDVTFENASAGHASTAWAYGNGEYSAIGDSIHTKTFFNPTDDLVVYTTQITVSNTHGCATTDAVEVEVGPYLNAQFDVVAQGCTPVEANIINQSEGAAAYIWNFSDGTASSNDENPTHTFVNATGEDVTYEVELIAMSAYGCSDTLAVGVEVYATPAAEFTVSPAIQTYPNTTVGINNLSTASSNAIQHWSFGDGAEVATDQPIFHTYNSWGSYNVTLLVDNGFCADAHTEVITILSPHPVASFTGSGSGCAPLAVDFENHSSHGAQYIWDFDDDVMTSEESPTHVFTRPGVYNVSLTVIGYEGQQEQVIQYGAVEVFPSASAAFVNSPTQVIVPDQPVDFVNLSEMDATEFFWDFGDGQFSTEKDPVHYYTEPGIYTVSLTANNSFNCPTTYTLEHAVEATVGGFMEFPTAFTPNTGGSNGGYYDPNALDNDVFHPHHMGIVDYELVIFNKWGELIFRSTDPYIGWDGYFQGRIVRQDVYAWKAIATFSSGYRTTQAGDVTLIK